MAAAPPQFAAGRRSAGRDPIAFLFFRLFFYYIFRDLIAEAVHDITNNEQRRVYEKLVKRILSP
jgi:hypothetical protein